MIPRAYRENGDKLSTAIYSISQLYMPCVPAYNEIHKHVGGEVYTSLPACNDIHSAVTLYSVSKFSRFEFFLTCCEYALLHALSSPFWGSISPGGTEHEWYKVTR